MINECQISCEKFSKLRQPSICLAVNHDADFNFLAVALEV